MHIQADRLGAILMIELRDSLAVPHGELTQLWENLDLPCADLPRAKGPKDAFRKATPRNKQANGLQLEPYLSRKKLDEKGLDLAVVMTRVSDAKTVVRKRHQNRIVIGLTKDYTLDLQGEPCSCEEQEYLAQITQTYENFTSKQMIDGSSVRSAVKNAALRARAIVVKGGVFLFPETGVSQAMALSQLAGELDRYLPRGTPPNETMTIDYLDTPLQRRQLKTKLDAYIRDMVEQAFTKLGSRHNGLSERGKESIFTELSDLGILINDYEALLAEQLTDLKGYMRLQHARMKQELAKL